MKDRIAEKITTLLAQIDKSFLTSLLSSNEKMFGKRADFNFVQKTRREESSMKESFYFLTTFLDGGILFSPSLTEKMLAFCFVRVNRALSFKSPVSTQFFCVVFGSRMKRHCEL